MLSNNENNSTIQQFNHFNNSTIQQFNNLTLPLLALRRFFFLDFPYSVSIRKSSCLFFQIVATSFISYFIAHPEFLSCIMPNQCVIYYHRGESHHNLKDL